MRLNKFLASSGIASRRSVEKIIFSGRVKVNGKKTLLPQTQINLQSDLVAVDEKPVLLNRTNKYFLLHKPKGYLCTNARPSKNSKIVLDLFPFVSERIFTVGRLDKDTEGLLLTTNDGDLANQIIHPSSNISKEYLVKAYATITLDHLKSLSQGAFIEGKWLRPEKVQKIRKNTCKITVKEGKKREIRIFCEKANINIISLKRTRIGGLLLGNLPKGTYKEVSKELFLSVFS